MKAYPSIETKINFALPYYLFDKLDGSNIRAEWNPKKGFYKFGSRTQLLTEDQVTLWPAKDAIIEDFSEQVSSKLSKMKVESAVCFFEWCGPNSFAGSHGDNTGMQPHLIDVAIYKKGMMNPEKFIEFADGMRSPKVLHVGAIYEELFQDVRHRRLEGITFEGVVGKEKNSKRHGGPLAFKIKTNDWLNKLKEFCNGDETLYSRLK